MKYKPGDVVWLAKFDNGDEIIPRQKCTILSVDWMYIGKVEPENKEDDGLREFSEEQIEGLA
jgi:hypothetical protein